MLTRLTAIAYSDNNNRLENEERKKDSDSDVDDSRYLARVNDTDLLRKNFDTFWENIQKKFLDEEEEKKRDQTTNNKEDNCSASKNQIRQVRFYQG
jgi:hypothetical protein